MLPSIHYYQINCWLDAANNRKKVGNPLHLRKETVAILRSSLSNYLSPGFLALTAKYAATPKPNIANSHNQALLPSSLSLSAKVVIPVVKVGWRVAVGLRVGLEVGVGSGVSVGGMGVKVGVAGGVTCSSSFSPG